MYFQKNGNSEGEGGVHDYGILRALGGNAFWNFRRHGGDKTCKPSVVGYGYFLELPIKFYLTSWKKNLEKVFITDLVKSNKSRCSIILMREPFPEKVTYRHVKLKYHDR